MKLRIATCVVALALGASSASAQSIGIYADPAAANCNITLPPFTPTNWYIMATLGGAAAGGISGAEFRVENWPSGGFDTVTPNPGSNLALGNPIAAVNPGCTVVGRDSDTPPTAAAWVSRTTFPMELTCPRVSYRDGPRLFVQTRPDTPFAPCPLWTLLHH